MGHKPPAQWPRCSGPRCGGVETYPQLPSTRGLCRWAVCYDDSHRPQKQLEQVSPQKNNPRSLRVDTIANSAGGTAQVALVAQPSIGFLNGRFNRDGTPTEDTEDCLGRITVGLTRSKSLTVLVSPLDMLGLMGMAQVLAAVAYGIKGVRRGETTWQWPNFVADQTLENQAQMARWSINVAPGLHFPPLAIANQYRDRETNQYKRQRYRLVLVKCSRYEWIARDRRDEVYAAVTTKHPWMPEQTLPSSFHETILFGYAADFTPLPTYICLSSGLYRATGDYLLTRNLLFRWMESTALPQHPSQRATNPGRTGQRDTACKSSHGERHFQTPRGRGTRDLGSGLQEPGRKRPQYTQSSYSSVQISQGLGGSPWRKNTQDTHGCPRAHTAE